MDLSIERNFESVEKNGEAPKEQAPPPQPEVYLGQAVVSVNPQVLGEQGVTPSVAQASLKLETQPEGVIARQASETATNAGANQQVSEAGVVEKKPDRPKKPNLTAKQLKERKIKRREAKIAAGTWVPFNPLKKKGSTPRNSDGGSSSAPKRPYSGESSQSNYAPKRPYSGEGSHSSYAPQRPYAGESSSYVPNRPRFEPSSSSALPRQPQGSTQSHPPTEIPSMNMAVVPINYPDGVFENRALLQLQKMLLPHQKVLANGTLPIFKDCRLDKGAIVFSCANNESKQWLEESVSLIGQLDGLQTMVTEASKLRNTVKVITTLPPCFDEIRFSDVLTELRGKNLGLNTADWRVLNVTPGPVGKTLVIAVTGADNRQLAQRQHKLFLGFGQISFRVVGANKNGDRRTSGSSHHEGFPIHPSAY